MKFTNLRQLFSLSACFIFFTTITQGQTTLIFQDVPETHQYARSINALHKQGVAEGHKKDDGRYFNPEQEINRAEALKLLLVSSQSPIGRDIKSPFSDVTVYDWFYPFVFTASEKGIVKGFADGSFKPGNQVILAEFIKMLVITFNIPTPELKDGEPWYKPYFTAAEALNVTLEDKHPTKNVTRGEAAAMIFKIQMIRYFSDWMN